MGGRGRNRADLFQITSSLVDGVAKLDRAFTR